MRTKDTGKYQARETRILDAAKNLIPRYGYDKTTVDDIAREAQVSKGAVYLHFTSKDALLDKLIAREFLTLMDDIIARLDSDPKGYTIFNVYRYSIMAVTLNPLLGALFAKDRRVLGNYWMRLKQTPQKFSGFEFGVDFVRHFQQAGMIDPNADPVAVAYILMAVRYGLLRIDEYAPPPPSIEKIGETIGEMLQKSFGLESGNSAEAKAALKKLFDAGRSMLAE